MQFAQVRLVIIMVCTHEMLHKENNTVSTEAMYNRINMLIFAIDNMLLLF